MHVPYRQNLRDWIDKADTDYFTEFVKAWIPFNAWYRHNYGEDDTERAIIDSIKSNPNVIRNHITALLQGNDQEALEFKSHVSGLHASLQNHVLANRGNTVTLTNCYIGKNALNQITEVHNGLTYRLERGTPAAPGSQVLCEILSRRGAQRFRKVQPRYDLADLQADPSFNDLSRPQCAQLEAHYRRINPSVEVNLLVDPGEVCLDIPPYRFCTDTEMIFAGLIEVIYVLRCMLLHGQIVPTSDMNSVFEGAYRVLRHCLRCTV